MVGPGPIGSGRVRVAAILGHRERHFRLHQCPALARTAMQDRPGARAGTHPAQGVRASFVDDVGFSVRVPRAAPSARLCQGGACSLAASSQTRSQDTRLPFPPPLIPAASNPPPIGANPVHSHHSHATESLLAIFPTIQPLKNQPLANSGIWFAFTPVCFSSIS